MGMRLKLMHYKGIIRAATCCSGSGMVKNVASLRVCSAHVYFKIEL